MKNVTNQQLIDEIYSRSCEWKRCIDPRDITYKEKYTRIFYINDESAGCFYGRNCCEAVAYIVDRSGNGTQMHVMLSFLSIDDGNVPLIGPIESEEKCNKRLDSIVNFMDFCYLPSLDRLQKMAQTFGFYVNV